MYVVCVFVVVWPMHTCSAAGNSDVGQGKHDRAVQILSDPYLFCSSIVSALNIDEQGRCVIPREACSHGEGVFSVGLAVFKFVNDSTDEAALTTNTPMVLRTVDVNLELNHNSSAKTIAVSFIGREFPWFFSQKSVMSYDESGVDGQGVERIKFQYLDSEGLFASEASVFVRVIDLRIISFSIFRRLRPWPSHKLSPLAVKGIVKNVVGSSVSNLRVVGFDLEEKAILNPENVHSVYLVSVQGRNASGAIVSSDIQIDANSGVLLDGPILWEKEEVKEDDIYDCCPVWTKGGLVFVSNRRQEGFPDWISFRHQMYIINASGVLFALTADIGESVDNITGSSDAPWISVSRGNWAYALNVDAAKWKVLCEPERAGVGAAVEPNGGWSVSCSNGADSLFQSVDLFSEDLSRIAIEPGVRFRRAMIGEQSTPAFSPDGAWLYFSTTLVRNGVMKVEIDRISRSVAESPFPVILSTRDDDLTNPFQWRTSSATKVVALPFVGGKMPRVERLSVFPSGKNLCVQTDQGLFIVSIDDSVVKKIGPWALIDPDTGARLVDFDNGWAGRTDAEIVFSGLEVGPMGRRMRRIFSLGVNGVGLKALTPLNDDVVKSYEFPEVDGDLRDSKELSDVWAKEEYRSLG